MMVVMEQFNVANLLIDFSDILTPRDHLPPSKEAVMPWRHLELSLRLQPQPQYQTRSLKTAMVNCSSTLLSLG